MKADEIMMKDVDISMMKDVEIMLKDVEISMMKDVEVELKEHSNNSERMLVACQRC
jgi:hypothetical protein